MSIKTIHPANGEILRSYNEMKSDQVKEHIDNAYKAWQQWKPTTFEDRVKKMHHVAALLKERKRQLAGLMTEEMGKVFKDGESEIDKCAWVCEYYADNAEVFLQPQKVDSNASNSYVAYNPLGIVLAIMPWNFPFWQVFRFAAPALMAGNAALLKHANNVTGCALAIQDIFEASGFPKDLFKSLIVETSMVEEVIENPLVRAVTLTGSTRAGRSVASIAGKNLKKTVLELGGSDAYVVLEDADVEYAAETCVNSRLINSGQSCIAAKRFVVVESVRAEFESLVLKKLDNKKMGDPWESDTDIGPMARMDLMIDLHKQVQESKEQGAVCLLGGEIPEGKGAFYPPTLLTNVKPGMPAYEEELFGPVASIINVKDEYEAIQVANATSYGLGAAVFTQHTEKGQRIAEYELEAGCCFVNDFVKSDPRLPFGGIKESGYGRELGHIGIKEFVNTKTVYIK